MLEGELRRDIGEERPALAERDGHDGEFDEVDQVVLQEQAGGDAAAEQPDVGVEILLAHALAEVGEAFGGIAVVGVDGLRALEHGARGHHQRRRLAPHPAAHADGLVVGGAADDDAADLFHPRADEAHGDLAIGLQPVGAAI